MKLNELFTNPATISSFDQNEKEEENDSPLKKKMKSKVEEEKI